MLNVSGTRETYGLERKKGFEFCDSVSYPSWLEEYIASIRGVLLSTYEDITSGNSEIPDVINGNHNMYRLIENLEENSGKINVPEFVKVAYRESRMLIAERSTDVSYDRPAYLLSETGKSVYNEFINCRKMESFLYKVTGSANSMYMNSVHSPPSELDIALGTKEKITSIPVYHAYGYDCCRVHDLLFVHIDGKVFVGHKSHFDKVCDFYKGLSNIIETLQYIPIRFSYYQFKRNLIRVICKIGLQYPEYVGEAMKAGRNICVISQDTDNIMDSRSELLCEMGEKKVRCSSYFIDFLKDTFKSSKDIVNFSHIYKIVLHPDIDLDKSFSKLSGLIDGKTIDKDTELIYEYNLRKRLYIAAKAAGYDARLEPYKGDRDLISTLNKATVTMESLRSLDPSKFSNTRFQKVTAFQNPELFILQPSSKSSAPFSGSTMKHIRKFDKIKGRMMFVKSENVPNPKPVNDVETTLRGIDELKGEPAFRRFSKLVEAYEKFESRFPNKSPEEIGASEIEGFFDENPDLIYLVLTEPKLGEKHKELTRMFYMGEQALKAVTTRIERIAKQLTRRQMGVSITKSYQNRKGDLEQMADSMLRVKEGYRNLFVSFDLSSFSMKYPHQLLRSYGAVLSEMTGCDSLRRLDLLFKCSIVTHNTRGFKNCLPAVKGAFEGFLNFVWTSSHAVILEIALEESNINGSMLTYSDDGLLKMVLPDSMTKEEVKAIARKIQAVYLRHGLEFNFSKTMCSERVWEYLGEICIEGTLTATYSKELCSFGMLEDSGDLQLTTTRFMTYVSQASALAKAGCPAMVCEFLPMFQCMSDLIRIFPDIPVDAIKALLLIPIEAGGLRVPTGLELSSISSVTSSSEFLSDMVIIRESSPKLIEVISTFLIENLPEKQTAHRSIVMGEYFPSIQGRLDGREIKNWLVERLRTRLGSAVPDNPLTSTRLTQLASVLRSIDNINPKVIARIVEATPQMQTYLEFCDNMTKSGALRLMRPVELVVAMNKDKRMLQRRLQNLRSLCSRRTLVSFNDYLDSVFTKYYSEYNVSIPKLSLRSCVRKAVANETPDVTLLIDITPTNQNHLTIADLNYTEPSMSTASPITSSIWSEHVSKSIELKDQRKYASFIASVLVASPELGDALNAISCIFGIKLPPLPVEFNDNVERIRKTKGKGEDITLFGERVLRARSVMRFSEKILRVRDNISSVDFTTLPGLLRLHACHILTYSGIYHKRPTMEVIRMPFVIINEDMFKNNEMKLARDLDFASIPDAPELSSRLKDEFKSQMNTVLNEARAACMFRELHNYSPEEVKEVSAIAIEVWVSDLSDWISKMAISDYHAGAVLPALMPIVPFSNPEINRRAIQEGLFKVVKYNRKISRLNSVEFNMTQATSDFSYSYSGYYEVLESAGVTLPPWAEVEKMFTTLEDDYKEWNEKNSVLKNAVLPIAVIDSKNCQSSQATSVRVKAIKSMVESTREHIYNVCSKNGWDSQMSATELNLRGMTRIDDLLNAISIVTPLMRASEHRSATHPYNQTMAEIETAKFIQTGINLMTLVKKELRSPHTATEEQVNTVIDYVKSVGALKIGVDGQLYREFMVRFTSDHQGINAHTDHIRALSETMKPSSYSRLVSLVRYCLKKRVPFPYSATKTDILSLLTFFYEVILRKCVSKLRIYSPTFREVIAEEAANIGQISVKLMEPDLPYGQFHGDLKREMTNIESRAAFGCFLLSSTKQGGYEFKIGEPLPNHLGTLLYNNQFLPDETKDHMPTFHMNSNNSPSFFCIDTYSLADVVRITTYISSSRSGNSIAYPTSTRSKIKYTVIGYAHSAGPAISVLKNESQATFEYLDSLPPEVDIVSSSISEWATNTITSFGYHLLPSSSSTTPLKRVSDLALLKSSDIFHVGRERIMIDDKVLGLASVLLTGTPSFREKVIAYMLIYKWLRSEDVEDLKDLEIEFRHIYNQTGLSEKRLLDYRKNLINDMEETTSWVRMSRMYATFESRKKFMPLHETFDRVEFKLSLDTKPRLPGIINPYLAVVLHRPTSTVPPYVSQVLYIMSAEPELGDI